MSQAERPNYDIKTEIAAYWDRRAETFDEAPSHAIRQGPERDAWKQLLRTHLEGDSPRILELGCGTGIITDLLCEAGCQVTAFDLAESMLKRARARIGDRASILFGDAEDPFPAEGPFDGIISRHLVWTLPNPEKAIARWRELLAPGGRLLIVDGYWGDNSLLASLLRRMASLAEPAPVKTNGPPGLTDPGSPYPEIDALLPFGINGAPPSRIAGLLADAGFTDIRIDPLSDLKRQQRSGRPLGFRLRSMSIQRYLVRGTA